MKAARGVTEVDIADGGGGKSWLFGVAGDHAGGGTSLNWSDDMAGERGSKVRKSPSIGESMSRILSRGGNIGVFEPDSSVIRGLDGRSGGESMTIRGRCLVEEKEEDLDIGNAVTAGSGEVSGEVWERGGRMVFRSVESTC